jgi:hypothetical protein
MKKLIKKRMHDRAVVHGYGSEKWVCSFQDCLPGVWHYDCVFGGTLSCQVGATICNNCGF